MNVEGKKELIEALCISVMKEILDNVGRMPPEWTGVELRAVIASRFAKEVASPFAAELKIKRNIYWPDAESLVRKFRKHLYGMDWR